jgi:hypothetical protein
MNTWEWSSKILAIGLALALLGGCAAAPPPYPGPNAVPPPEESAAPPAPTYLSVGPQDHLYIMHVDNQTPFRIRLPQVHRILDEKGYDPVRRQREADFALNILLITEARDNPNVRGEHLLGGAILGAATGALIGAVAGRPALGAIAGAAGGGVLGLAAPADTPVVRIDVRTQSFRDGTTSEKTAVVDMARVPPYDVPRVIDIQISRMLEDLPAR